MVILCRRRCRVDLLIVALLGSAPVLLAQFPQASPPFDNCDRSVYYNSLLDSTGSVISIQDGNISIQQNSGDMINAAWSMESLRQLVTTTHRNVLPNVGGSGANQSDIYEALIALFPGNISTGPNKQVHLAFRDISIPAVPFANPNTWSRADIWPISRGSAFDSPALTDVHSKMCGDSTVLKEWNDLFFGECGTVQDEALCFNPDTTAPDCFSDGKIWTPPARHRGDIARMLMYNVLRYGADLGLELVDCPPFTQNQFGYKSTLLSWHQSDPPDDVERARNDAACVEWQGNRNPLVDHPELATQWFGPPDSILPGTRKFSECVAQTSSPTASPNSCSSLAAGDIQVLLMNSEEPTELAFFTLALIPAAVGHLYVTNDNWDGNFFMGNQGTIKVTIPEETTDSDGEPCYGLCPGTWYTWGFAGDAVTWEPMNPAFPFTVNASGDFLFTYCLNADQEPYFLNGFNFAPQGWVEPGLPAYESGQTALPAALQDQGSVALPYFKNYIYNGTFLASKKALVTEHFNNPDSYSGSDTIRNTIPGMNTSGAAARITIATALATAMLGLLTLW